MDVRFQVCFTPLAAVLFAFPSRYWFAIGHHGVFSLGEWSPRIRTGFHVSRPTWDADRPDQGFRLRGFHPLWPLFPEGSAIPARAMARSRNPGRQAFRSVAPAGLSLFIPRRRPVKDVGFPHSEIPGSKPFGGSPELIAALCVLHRLMMPRHPSHARIRLARNLAISLRCNSL